MQLSPKLGGSLKSLLLICSFLISCTAPEPLKYGFLPASDYPFYPPNRRGFVNGRLPFFVIRDNRKAIQKADCSTQPLQGDSELEGELGRQFFSRYLNYLTTAGLTPTDRIVALDTFNLDIQVMNPVIVGFLYLRIHGVVQFSVSSHMFSKTYCVDLVDGDPDSPLGKYDWDTRRGAMRKMMAAALKKAVDQFAMDYEVAVQAVSLDRR